MTQAFIGGAAMTRRRAAVLLAVAIAVAIGGVVSSRFRGGPPDEPATKADDPPLLPPPAPATKATAPARELNERERMLVGIWKFNESMPPNLHPGYEATVEYRADGTLVYRCRSHTMKPYTMRGTWQVVGDRYTSRNASGGVSSIRIDVLTEDRKVSSYPDGDHRHVEEWLRVKELPRWD